MPTVGGSICSSMNASWPAVARQRGRKRPPAPRGYERLYQRSVQQAPLGADFDFLRHESLQGA